MRKFSKAIALFYAVAVLSASLLIILDETQISRTDALTSVCGNKKIEQGEVCDDGNTKNGDQCSYNCKNKCTGTTVWNNKFQKCVNVCGNGVVNAGANEICDDGNRQNGDQCSSNCKQKCEGTLVWNGTGCVSSLVSPTFVWADREAGAGAAKALDVTTDASGNVYVVGQFNGDVNFGTGTITPTGTDFFIVKYSPTGTVLWVDHVNSGSGSVTASSVATDASGNVYVAGSFKGTFDFGTGSWKSAYNGYDYFVAKYDADGSLIWVDRENGGEGTATANDIAVDANGNVYVAGTRSDDVDFGVGGMTEKRVNDFFLLKYNSSGEPQWVQKKVDTLQGYASANGVAVDANGNVYITGSFSASVDFGKGLWTAKNIDYFVGKYDTNGELQWIDRENGGAGWARASVITVDAIGNVYVGGNFDGTVNFGAGNWTDDDIDFFIVKYNTSGVYQWAKRETGAGRAEIYGLDTDASGNLYAAGYFWGTINFGSGNWTATSTDYLVLKYNPSGTLLAAKKEVGGAGNSEAAAIAVDSANNFYTVGYITWSASPTEKVNVGAGLWTVGGDNDYFIVKHK
jgi:cysteine-rich repeat protein